MKKYLSVCFDGCNGFVRGKLYGGVPEDFGERNLGSGIFENEEGEVFFIELRDEKVVPVSEYGTGD